MHGVRRPLNGYHLPRGKSPATSRARRAVTMGSRDPRTTSAGATTCGSLSSTRSRRAKRKVAADLRSPAVR